MVTLVAAAGLLAGIAVATGGVWWVRRRYAVVTVVGDSMVPAYRDGDRVVVRRIVAGACAPAMWWCSKGRSDGLVRRRAGLPAGSG